MHWNILLPSCCTCSQCLVHPPLQEGNEWMHHISLWLGLQPNCWDRSLAYFLLNDLEKACLYHETTWIIFCLCPISSSSLHTMRPTAVFPLRCQEWIYWLHQFLNLLLYSWKKTAFSMYGMKYRFWSLLWIITVWKCEYRSISDLLLIMHLFPFISSKSPSLLSSSCSLSQVIVPGVGSIYLMYSLA